MPKTMIQDFNVIRSISSFLGAGILWIADTAMATPDTFWLGLLKEVGLPTAMLVCAVYGLYHLSKKLSAAEEARTQDQKDMLAQYREDMTKADASRRELIRELRDQTNVIREKS